MKVDTSKRFWNWFSHFQLQVIALPTPGPKGALFSTQARSCTRATWAICAQWLILHTLPRNSAFDVIKNFASQTGCLFFHDAAFLKQLSAVSEEFCSVTYYGVNATAWMLWCDLLQAAKTNWFLVFSYQRLINHAGGLPFSVIIHWIHTTALFRDSVMTLQGGITSLQLHLVSQPASDIGTQELKHTTNTW